MLRAIAARGALARGAGQSTAVQRIIAVDRTQPATLFLDRRIEYVRGDYEQPRFLARMMGTTTDSIFHLAALGAGIGSEQAPADLEVALLHSFDTTRALLQACRYQSLPPKLVLASSMDAGPHAGPWPQATDGLCAALCELLVVEAARRRIVDARCVRLPCLVGNGTCREDLVLQKRLADIAAGRAPADAAQDLTTGEVAFLDEAAGAMLDAHERPQAATGEPQITEVRGRRVRIGELLAALAPAAGAGSLGA